MIINIFFSYSLNEKFVSKEGIFLTCVLVLVCLDACIFFGFVILDRGLCESEC